jgi:hypothetical protein
MNECNRQRPFIGNRLIPHALALPLRLISQSKFSDAELDLLLLRDQDAVHFQSKNV